MEVIFSNRAYLAVITETAEKIKTETGGIFLGCYENGIWYVIEAIDPGPKSIFQVAYFEYDRKYTEHLINKIARLYQSKLTLIGLWHRHPGSLDVFSSTDDGTNSDYAKLSPYGAISMLVNIDNQFRLTAYHVSPPYRYTKISYRVGDDMIPKEFLKLKEINKVLEIVNNYVDKSYRQVEKPEADFVTLLDAMKTKFKKVVLVKEDIVLDETEEHIDFLIDALLDDITYFSEKRGLSLKTQQTNGIISLAHKGVNGIVTKVSFLYLPHKQIIVFDFDKSFCEYTSGLFATLLADYQPPKVSFIKRMVNELSGKKDDEG